MLWEKLSLPEWSGWLEILVLSVAFYYIILFFRGTRGAQVLSGLVGLLIFLAIVTRVFHLNTLHWVLQNLSGITVIAFVVIFQAEIRRALAELGKQQLFGGGEMRRTLVEQVAKAVEVLAEHKIGALIAIERSIATRIIQESGIRLDCTVTPELLATLFFPRTPLHDGGVIISNNRVVAARCVFPLSVREELSTTLGTRHRAAIGLTEETDALVVVVSEETGTVSVAYRGRLSRGLDHEQLRRVMTSVLHRTAPARGKTPRAREQLETVPGTTPRADTVAATEVAKHAG